MNIETLYLSKLSSRQKIWFVASLIAVVFIMTVGILREPERRGQVESHFTIEVSMRQIAPKLGVTGKAMARELDLFLNTPKNKPLKELGVSQKQLDKSVRHILSHRTANLMYYAYATLVLFGLVFLTRLGRPELSDISQRRFWYPRIAYIAALLISVTVCGFILGKSPNPLQGIVQVFKAMAGLYPKVTGKIIVLVFFISLALVGEKLVCGWACPFGSLQELFYSLPIFRRAKRWKLPFWLTNTIRTGLFIVMLLFLFGIVGGKKGFVVYHGLNPFNLFNFDFDEYSVLVTVIAALVLSLFMYRPFCQLICPFGFVSWLVKPLGLVRVRIDKEKCTKCGACIQACPSGAARGKVEGRVFGADCFSCARCLNTCPVDAIRYGFVPSRNP